MSRINWLCKMVWVAVMLLVNPLLNAGEYDNKLYSNIKYHLKNGVKAFRWLGEAGITWAV